MRLPNLQRQAISKASHSLASCSQRFTTACKPCTASSSLSPALVSQPVLTYQSASARVPGCQLSAQSAPQPVGLRAVATHSTQVDQAVTGGQQVSIATSTSLAKTVHQAGGDSSGSQQPSMAGSRRAGSAGRQPLQLDNINNIRDLSEAHQAIQPGRVIRCAKPSLASDADVALLLDELGIRELLDLRAYEEVQEDLPSSKLFARAEKMRTYHRSLLSGQIHLPHEQVAGHQVQHHQVSLLDRLRYYVSLLWHLPLPVTSSAIANRLLGRQQAFRDILLKDVNAGGLLLLYKMLADSARPEIATALRVVSRALEQQRPVLMFCKAGKDRTGIMAMLLLHIAGATRDEILTDYHKSDAYHKVALAGIEKKEELQGLDMSVFERAPRAAMSGLLDWMQQRWGSVDAYLDMIGFGAQERQHLRQLLTEPYGDPKQQ